MLQKSIASVLEHCPIDGITAELLVVENTPKDYRKTIELPTMPGVRQVVCDHLGLAHARNAALANSESEFIVFLDDDAFVRPGWAEAYLKTFAEQPDAWVVGGRCYAVYELDPLPKWFDKSLNGYLSCIDWGDEGRFITPAEWVVGANVAFRRQVFERFGMFDPTLGRKGAATLLSNEETALMEKIGREHIYYQPTAAVDHVVPADRISLTWFRKRAYWQAVSDLLSGTPRYPLDYAMKEYGRIVVESEAENRNLDLFTYRPRNFADFGNQLEAIYIAAIAGAQGYGLANV
jgi:glycosyltransferase involved in cell wall biosynthesis